MNTNDISVDCETLGTDFDAPIVAIGAAAFDRTTGKIGPTFYEVVYLQSAISSGRVDAKTVHFWITQASQAKDIFSKGIEPGTKSLATVLLAFSDFCRAVGKGVPRLWVKGPAEDATWIKHAMVVGGHGLHFPFHHQNVRDVRTIIELAEELKGFNSNSVPEVGTYHNALDDAIYQAFCVYGARQSLRDQSAKYDLPKAAKAAPKPTPEDDDDL